MQQHEHETVKKSLERLKQIEKSCEESIIKHFNKAEYDMYHNAKAFVEAFEAREKAANNFQQSKHALRIMEEQRKRDEAEDEDDCECC